MNSLREESVRSLMRTYAEEAVTHPWGERVMIVTLCHHWLSTNALRREPGEVVEVPVIEAVYTRQGRAVVCGIPGDSHNCDEMACPSVEHVLWRGPHIVDEKPPRDPMTDWRNGENMAAQNKRSSFDELVDVVTGKPIDPMKRSYGGVTKEQFAALASSQAGKCDVEPSVYWAVRNTHEGKDSYMLDTKEGWTWVDKAENASRFATRESAKVSIDLLEEKYPMHSYSAVRVTSYRPTQEPGR